MTTAPIKVFLRFRPPKDPGLKTGVAITDNTVNISNLSFSFDHILPSNATQKEVYIVSAKPLLKDLLQGFDVCIFCYGQTSSGKTHTFQGTKTDPGIVERLCTDLLKAVPAGTRISLSCLEIYMEQIFDLLEKKGGSGKSKQIRELPNGSVYVENLEEIYVNSMEQILAYMQTADVNRTVAETLMNDRSSRSHSVFQLQINQPNGVHSRLFTIDTAGSEKVKKSGASGLTLAQAQHINKSLFTLSNVIHVLSEGKSNAFVNYRDSKLTRLLQSSLGGTAKTSVIICALPTEDSLDETISTLRFGARCKLVINKPKQNTTEMTLDAYKQKLAAAEAEIARLVSQGSKGKSDNGNCEKCALLEHQLEEYKLRDEAAATISDSESKNWEKYLVKPLSDIQPMSAAELRQLVSQFEVGQKFLEVRQHLLFKHLASRNALIQALEKKLYTTATTTR